MSDCHAIYDRVQIRCYIINKLSNNHNHIKRFIKKIPSKYGLPVRVTYIQNIYIHLFLYRYVICTLGRDECLRGRSGREDAQINVPDINAITVNYYLIMILIIKHYHHYNYIRCPKKTSHSNRHTH